MTDLLARLAEMRAVAVAATQDEGCWTAIDLEHDTDPDHPQLGPRHRYVIGNGRYGPVIATLSRGLKHPATFESQAQHIATFDPALVPLLLDVVEQALRVDALYGDGDIEAYTSDAEDVFAWLHLGIDALCKPLEVTDD